MIRSLDIFQEILIMNRFPRKQADLGGKIGNAVMCTGDVVRLWTSVICFY